MKTLVYTLSAVLFLAVVSSVASAHNSTTTASPADHNKVTAFIAITLLALAAIVPPVGKDEKQNAPLMPVPAKASTPPPAPIASVQENPAPVAAPVVAEVIPPLPPNATRSQVKKHAEKYPQCKGIFDFVWNFYKDPNDPTSEILISVPGCVQGAGTSNEEYFFDIQGQVHSLSHRNRNARISELLIALQMVPQPVSA